MATESKLFDGLNERQRQAVMSEDKRMLILAGARAGKTSTIIRKIPYLIFEKNVKPGATLTVTLSVLLSLSGLFNVVAQERRIVIQGNHLDLQLGDVHVDELYFMDKEFIKLEKLGTPEDVHFEDRYSELYWVYSFENFNLTYVDHGDGPVLYQLEVHTPTQDIQLEGVDVTTLHTLKDDTFGSNNNPVIQVDKDAYDNQKFGDFIKYIEVIIQNDRVTKLIYRYDLQI